jgi:hypothetical protein
MASCNDGDFDLSPYDCGLQHGVVAVSYWDE